MSLADLSPDAGRELVASAAPAASSDPIVTALIAQRGNVSRVAKQLGISRSKVRRHVDKHAIDLDALRE